MLLRSEMRKRSDLMEKLKLKSRGQKRQFFSIFGNGIFRTHSELIDICDKRVSTECILYVQNIGQQLMTSFSASTLRYADLIQV